jgi:hypothetical protein
MVNVRTQKRAFAAVIGALCAMPALAADSALKSPAAPTAAVRIEALDPFTHLADIPEGSDLSSIKFQGVKMVSVATQRKSTIDLHYCEQAAMRDPGGSAYCPSTQLQAPSPAYQVTYSYSGRPMASDEFGSRGFTFSVYLRPEELSPAVREKLSRRGMAKAEAADLFKLSNFRAPVRRVAIDEAASKFCGGNFIDGSWTHSDPKCQDQITYKTVTSPLDYVTVRVDPVVLASGAN